MLHVAAHAAPEDLIEEMLRAGADVNAKNADGNPLLCGAMEEGKKGLIKKLMRAGADASIKGKWGVSAREMAQKKGWEGLLQAQKEQEERSGQKQKSEEGGERVEKPDEPMGRKHPYAQMVEQKLKERRLKAMGEAKLPRVAKI